MRRPSLTSLLEGLGILRTLTQQLPYLFVSLASFAYLCVISGPVLAFFPKYSYMWLLPPCLNFPESLALLFLGTSSCSVRLLSQWSPALSICSFYQHGFHELHLLLPMVFPILSHFWLLELMSLVLQGPIPQAELQINLLCFP